MRGLLLAPFRILWWIVRAVLGLAGALAALVLGKVHWQAPAWLRWIGRGVQRFAAWSRMHPTRGAIASLAIVALLVAGVLGAWWVERMPKPVRATLEVTHPPRTTLEDDGAQPQPVTVTFSASVARLDLVGKPVPAGITLSPALEGEWAWVDDKVLAFTPRSDWPVGATFDVAFTPAILRDDARVAARRFTFRTAPFEARIAEAQFHQDPEDAAGKRIVATISFSHPVDTAALERRIVLRQAGQSSGFLGIGAQSTRFRVTYDRQKLNAYVQSEPLAIPERETTADLTVEPGVTAARGGPATGAALAERVTIPGRDSLRIARVTLGAADNERHEPVRILSVQLSMPTHEREVVRATRAWVLPLHHPDTPEAERRQPHRWTDPARIGPEILAQSTAVTLVPQPGDREVQGLHNFRADAPAERFVYVKVDEGITSFGGYRLPRVADRIVRAERFPRQVRILGEGALLALSGERRLSVMARDAEGVRVEIGRVLPQQLQHLVTQSSGRFATPSFDSQFDESNLVERFSQVIMMPDRTPGKPSYHPVDLGRYLDGEGRRGIFFVKVESYDPARRQATGAVDRRFIVVSDLGVIVKSAVDGTHDVFVQSIATGTPVAGAGVEVMGRNGLALATESTDAGGRARLGRLDRFTRERAPAMYVVRKGTDLSFMPIDRADRRLDLSRFDVGGVDDAMDAGKLQAYLFSDRGLYRPGEEMRFGMIVRTADWSPRVAGLPLELELTDARGIAVRRERIRVGAGGFDEFRHATGESSPSGDYTLNLYTVKDGEPDAQIGSAIVRVAEFLPDRMRMTVRLTTETSEGWVSPQGLKARVNLQNLFGTPAENRRVSGTMTLAPQFPAFTQYRDYRFTDPHLAKEGLAESLGEVQTNDRGEAELDLDLARFARATWRVQVVAQGFEADGGRAVSAGTTQLVSAMPYLVGYKADGDLAFVHRGAERSVDLIAVDPRLQRVRVSELTVVHMERRFVSMLTTQSNGTLRYETRRRDVELDRQPLVIADGGTRQRLATDTPGAFTYVVRDAAGLELARIDYTVAGAANLARSMDRNAELQLTLDRRDYRAGDEIELSIVAPYTGSGLVTIERDRVYHHQWFRTETNATTQRIRVPDDLEGNAYVMVTFARDPASDEIYTSPLSYAAQPFSIALDRRRNAVTLEAPRLAKPGETLALWHRAERPARAVVFAVDEGILQVAKYRTADPLGHFFQKRALGVRTAQILDLVLPEFKRLMAAAAPGGGDASEIDSNLNPFKRRRDVPAVFWSGIVPTGPEGGEVRFTVPETFNGTLRVMAVAVDDASVGVAEERTVVRGDFVLTPNAPTTVAPGDEFEVSIGVANNVAGSGRDARVAVTVVASAHFEAIGASRSELSIDEGRERPARFRFRVKGSPGAATLAFQANLRDKTAAATAGISVRPATPYMVEVSAGVLRDGRTDVPVRRSMHDAFAARELVFARVPAALAGGLVSYLQAFPYSCTEQLVSMGMPALVLGARPELGRVEAPAGQGVGDVVRMLRARQNTEGGFGLWAANPNVVPPVSVYAQQFLVEARERGQAIPADLLKHGNDYLRQLAESDGETLADERARAQAAYLLTRQGVVTGNIVAGVQKRLEASHARTWRTDIAAAYLAASQQLMKQAPVAERLIDGVPFGAARPHEAYYDALTHDAQLLALVARHFPERAKRLPPAVFDGLAKAISSGGFNTLSSAHTLLAVDAYAQHVASASTGTLAASEVLRAGATRALVLPSGLLPRVAFSGDAERLQLQATGDAPAWWSASESGFDRAAPTVELKAGLEIQREYLSLDGKPAKSVKLGDELDVRLTFRTVGRDDVPNTAIVDLLPGGFEIVPVATNPKAAAREPDAAQGWRPQVGTRLSDWSPEYADVREDRIVLYGTVGRDARRFVYRVKATNVGSFAVPPAYAESMYERAVKARSLGGRIEVLQR